MWKHQIIVHTEEYLRTKCHSEDFYFILKCIYENLKTSHNFHLEKINMTPDDYDSVIKSAEANPEYVEKIPYSSTLLTFSVFEVKYGLLFANSPFNENKIEIRSETNERPIFYECLFTHDTETKEWGPVDIIAFYEGLRVSYSNSLFNEYSEQQKKGLCAFSRYILYKFLLMLSCKNIKKQERWPGGKKTAKKIRQGKVKDLYSYYILNIIPNQKKANNTIEEPTGLHNRVHFCRGSCPRSPTALVCQ